MDTFKARGLVLRESESGESDKRITLLCVNRGRLTVYARGARKVKSKFLAASQPLTYGDYIIADGGRFYSLNQAEVIEGFYPIREDYNKLCHAHYVLEICEKAVPDRAPCDALLKLALKTLQHISSSVITPSQAVDVFLFRFFLFNGIAPEMGCCCVCGGETENMSDSTLDNTALFCDEGMVCSKCQSDLEINSDTHISLSQNAREALRHMLSAELNQAFMFRASESVHEELALAGQLCWAKHFSVTLLTEL